jgi:hypothetical protein
MAQVNAARCPGHGRSVREMSAQDVSARQRYDGGKSVAEGRTLYKRAIDLLTRGCFQVGRRRPEQAMRKRYISLGLFAERK